MESFNHRYSHLDVDTKREYVNFGNRLLSLIKSDAYLELDGNTDFTIKRVPYSGTSTTPVEWPEWSFDAGNELPPSGFDADNESPGGFDAGNESPGGFDAGNESRPDGFDADNESPVQTQSGNENRCRDQTTAGQTDPPNPDGSGSSPQPEIPSNLIDGVRSSAQISNSSAGKRKAPTPPPPEETNCAKTVKRTKTRHGSPGKRKTRQFGALEILMVEMPTKWHKKAANALMDQTRSSLENQFNIRGVGVIDASSLNDDLQKILTATTTGHQIYLEFEDQNFWYFETSTMLGDDKKRFGKLYSHLEKSSQEYNNYMKQKQRAQAATDDQEQATSSSIQH